MVNGRRIKRRQMLDHFFTSLPDAIQYLRTQPGIDISLQRPGAIVQVVTNPHVYELSIISPQKGLVRVTGNDTRLGRAPLIGEFQRSIYGLDEAVFLDRWVGRAMRMMIRFKNGVLTSSVVTSASVAGNDWHYRVF
jgi:hypothetical protein